jgi:lysophospholipase L1-like esterase
MCQKISSLKNIFKLFTLLLLLSSCNSYIKNEVVSSSDYLKDLKLDLQKKWPKNRTINLVFHGHSVPAGYFTTPVVNTSSSYPYLLLRELKNRYSYAVINIINTSIGGENSLSGAKRFNTEVLAHKPDLIFIDYALNDRSPGLRQAREAWEYMILESLKRDIKVILLTPSPDQRVSILEGSNDLEKHALQIKALAKKYGVGLVDSYELFHEIAVRGDSISNYMSQVNHPNERGHQLITNDIMKYFQ